MDLLSCILKLWFRTYLYLAGVPHIYMLCQKMRTSPNFAGLVNFNRFRRNNLPSESLVLPQLVPKGGVSGLFRTLWTDRDEIVKLD